jgi:hypothetical protein
MSSLSPAQISSKVYDEGTDSIKVALIDAALELSAADGDSVIAIPGIEPRGDYDYVGLVYTSGGAVVTKTYRSGGAAGTIVGVVTETYSDGTRVQLNSIART